MIAEDKLCYFSFDLCMYFHEYLNFEQTFLPKQQLKTTVTPLKQYLSKCTNPREIMPPILVT